MLVQLTVLHLRVLLLSSTLLILLKIINIARCCTNQETMRAKRPAHIKIIRTTRTSEYCQSTWTFVQHVHFAVCGRSEATEDELEHKPGKS